MSVRLIFEGMDEFRNALRNLPAELVLQAKAVVSEAAQEAMVETVNGYPIRQSNVHPTARRKTTYYPPGNLRRRVVITNKSNNASALFIVRSAAPHAHLFEFGTARRQTASGANRGSMPAAQLADRMIPKVVRIRRRMVERLLEIVRSAGFVVTEQ